MGDNRAAEVLMDGRLEGDEIGRLIRAEERLAGTEDERLRLEGRVGDLAVKVVHWRDRALMAEHRLDQDSPLAEVLPGRLFTAEEVRTIALRTAGAAAIHA